MVRLAQSRLLQAASLVTVAGLAVSGCAKTTTETPAGAAKVTINLTNDGCKPVPDSVPAGPITFEIKNVSGDKVSEAELMKDALILGEKENLTPGLSGSFSLNLDGGQYTMYCPNASTEKFPFTVTGKASAPVLPADVQAALTTATKSYQEYIISEVALLEVAAKQFTDAVRAGDVNAAKASFAAARFHYETIEPVAESFGDLDPAIDAREDDVTDPTTWTGFHRLEKALWADNSLVGMAPIADQLDADIAKLKTQVATTTYQPAQMANGAVELLNEVASSKITGEEDRYSHTDLSDFEANVQGSQKAFDLLKPALEKIDPDLAATVSANYADVLAAIAPYKQGDGYVDYSTVTDDQRKVLTQKVDALAEPLSHVAAKVNG